jgi:hypothetical protein
VKAAGDRVAVLGEFPARGQLGLDDLGGADARILGEATNDYAGTTLAGVGDTDGDGKGDILVGAPYQDYGLGSLAGSAYLVLGTGL